MPLKAKRIDSELGLLPKTKAAFIEPMLLLRTETLPEGAEWPYELKLDGYRALANKSRSRSSIAGVSVIRHKRLRTVGV